MNEKVSDELVFSGCKQHAWVKPELEGSQFYVHTLQGIPDMGGAPNLGKNVVVWRSVQSPSEYRYRESLDTSRWPACAEGAFSLWGSFSWRGCILIKRVRSREEGAFSWRGPFSRKGCILMKNAFSWRGCILMKKVHSHEWVNSHEEIEFSWRGYILIKRLLSHEEVSFS